MIHLTKISNCSDCHMKIVMKMLKNSKAITQKTRWLNPIENAKVTTLDTRVKCDWGEASN